jgi:hypothetical protein
VTDLFASIAPVDFAALLRPQAVPAREAATPAPAGGARHQDDGRAGRTIVSRAGKRRLAGLRKAADVLAALPERGEVLWGILYGYFDLCHLLIALLDRLAVPCLHLRVATLSLSLRNVHELAALLDCGAVRRLSVVTSDFQRKHDTAIFAALLGALRQRGQRVAAARSHCKLLLLDMGDGQRWTLSGSPNLRTSRNAECFALCREGATDAPVHDFHAAWIDEVMVAHEVHASDGAAAG